jgi:uncharacterized protein
MFHIIQREEKYFESFKEMTEQINSAAGVLVKLFDDIGNAGQYADELGQIERRCDEQAHGVLRRVNKSFITPMDREDIFALVNALDTVVDRIEETAARVVMYGVAESTPAMQDLAGILAQTAAATGRSVAMLPTNEGLIESLVEVHNLETKANALFRAGVRELFAECSDPLTIIKRKEIYETLEASIASCDLAANVLEGAALKNT